MEEEKKEEIETLENTAPIETLTEEAAQTEAVSETEPNAEIYGGSSPLENTQPVPVAEIKEAVEQPVEPVVEPSPVVETATEAAVETAQEVAPTTPVEPTPVVPEVTPEVKPEEKPKKGKGGLIIIILLILVLAGFAVWYFVLGGNGAKKEEPKKEEQEQEEKKEEEKEEEVPEVTNDEIKALGKKLVERYADELYGADCKSKYSDILDKDLTEVKDFTKEIYSKYIFKYFIGLTTHEKIDEGRTDEVSYTSKVTLSKDDYIKYGKILFGSDFNPEIVESGKVECITFNYDKEKEVYNIISPGGCGGLCSPGMNLYAQFDTAVSKGNNLIVTYKVVYPDVEKVEDHFVVTYYGDKEFKNKLDATSQADIDYSKGTPFEITFVKNGEEYSFVKAEKK